MHKLAGTIVLTSQGVSFLHAGVDFLRTKDGVENSFNSPDAINQIDWSRKHKYREIFDYFRELIAIRKAHPAFRMTSTADIQKNLEFIDTDDENLVAYTLNGAAVGDSWKRIVVAYNGKDQAQGIEVPSGNWKIVVDGGVVNTEGIGQHNGGMIPVSRNAALILVEE